MAQWVIAWLLLITIVTINPYAELKYKNLNESQLYEVNYGHRESGIVITTPETSEKETQKEDPQEEIEKQAEYIENFLFRFPYL